MNKDGVVSIGIEYKKEFNQMISDYESALSEMASNKTLSKGMKTQFENVIAELRSFKAEMDKQLSDLSIGKVDVTKFESFKKSVSKKFESINGDISTLNTAVSLLNEKMDMVGNGIDLSKVQNEFKGLEDYINRTNDAVSEFVKRMDGQGIHLFSYDKTNQKEIQSVIKMIDSELKNLDKDYGAKFELFDEKEAQNELDKLATELRSTMELLDSTKSRLSNMDSSSDIFKKTTGEITALELKAARLSDTMEILYDIASEKKLYIDITDDKNLASYDKYVDELSIGLDEVSKSAERAKKELSGLLGDIKSANPVQVSDKLNPNSAQLTAGVTIETNSNELWKKISPVLTDLQGKLNSNPVIAPVKLVVAPTAVSQNDNPDQSISTAYSKKYAKQLAKTGEEAVIDMEGVYKKTYTTIMDEAVKCAEESITKIQGIFENSPIAIKLQLSQEELDKINNFVLSNKDEKKIDISGQVDKVKTDVSELNDKLKETTELIQKTSQNGSVKFDGIEEFTKQITNSLSSLEKLQDILKTLQNVEITLANASGLSSITEINNQWESLSKRINNAIKADGTFRKNANVGKLAEEYQKYLDMGGKNELSSISKLKDNGTVINAITSKMKELSSQKVDTSSVDKAVDSFDKFKSSLDDIVAKLDHLVNLTKNIGNTFYKMFKDASISDTDKQWSSIESKFKSIADESDKINLSKQKKDIQELVEMYQKYANAGGMKTPFDLTDNAETIKKMNKVYEQMNSKKDGTSVTNETKNFTKVEDSVNSLTSAINIKTEAIKTEANTMELAARAEVKSIQKIIDELNPLIEKIENIPELKIPKEDTILPSKESNISLASNNIKSQIKDVELLTDKTGKLLTVYRGVNSAYTGLHSNRYGGKTFLTAGFGLSESYSGVQNDLQGKIYKANLALKNPLEFNAHGSSWNNISLSDIPQLDDYLKKIQVEVSNKITSFYKSLQNIKDVDIRNIIESALQNVELRTNDHFENNNFDILNSFTGELLGDGTYFEQYFENIISNIPNIVENDISNIDLSKAKNILEDKLKELYDIKKTLADNMLLLDGDYTQSMIPVSYEKAQNYYTDEIIHLAQNAGFDSAIFKNLKDGSNNNEDIFAVFDENQIKNAQLVDLKLEQLKKDYKSLMDIINEYRSAYDINGSLEDAIKSFVNEYWNLDPYEDKYFDSSFIDKAINSGKVKEVEYELTSFDEDTGEQTYKAKEGELERFLSELTKYAQDIQEQYAKINSATASTEPTKDAIQVNNSSTTNASTSAIKEENNALEQTAQSAEKAANSKKKFAKANKKVKDSADASKTPVKEEADALKEVAKAAEKSKDRQKAKDDTQASVNKALKDQITAWKNIQSIREKIAKSDDSDEVANLQQVKKEYQHNYVEALKILKINTSLYNSELQVAKLEQIRLETNRKIADYQTSQLSVYEKQRKSYVDKLTGYTDSSKYTTDFVNRANALKDEVDALNFTNPQDVARLQEIDAEVIKISNDSKLLENKLVKQQSKLAEIVSQMKIFKSQNTNMSSSQKAELDQIIKYAETMQQSGKEVASEVENIKVRFAGLKAVVNETGNTGKNFFDQIGNRLTDMNSKFVAQFLSWQDWIRYIQQAAQMVIKLNTNITELAKVSEQSSKQIYADFDSYADIAKEVRGTISDTIAATADWSKNGYSIPDAKQLAEISQLYRNVGDGIDIDTANESLISTLKGFQLEAKEAEHIVDVFNEVSNNEAISSGGIGDALQRSAASFNAANTSLEKSVALVTATNSVLQDPEKVGNMWKTVSARIRGAKTELEEAGEDTDGMVESTSKLQALIKGMTGFDIMESDGKTFKDIYDIIIGIGEKWQDLNDIDRASLLEKLAGKNQSNALAAAFSNIDILKKSYEEATNAEGSAREENEEYAKSIQASIDLAKAKLEELANDFLSSDFLKGAIDAGGKFIDILDGIVNHVGILRTAFIGLTGYLTAKNANKLGYASI